MENSEIKVGVWVEPQPDFRTVIWARQYEWPMRISEVRGDVFVLEGASGCWSTTGLRVVDGFDKWENE